MSAPAMPKRQELLVQRPERPGHLVLLFHGVGASAQDLQPLGEALAQVWPQACIASIGAPHPSDFGSGWQWFSVQGVTEADRPRRVAAAMPDFLAAVARWQQASGLGPAQTTLIGFSQGAILVLESTQLGEPPAARAVALAGRLAQPPRSAARGTQFHLLHGDSDPVMPVQLAVDVAQQLAGIGAAVTLDRFPGLGHGIDARMFARLCARLGLDGPTAGRADQ